MEALIVFLEWLNEYKEKLPKWVRYISTLFSIVILLISFLWFYWFLFSMARKDIVFDILLSIIGIAITSLLIYSIFFKK